LVSGERSNMDFDQARKVYEDLLAKYQDGESSAEEFETAVNAIVITDPPGTHWQIGVKSGSWYRFDGRDWVKDTPPSEEADVESIQKKPPKPADPAPAPRVGAKPPRQRRIWAIILLIVGLLVIGLAAICCLAIAGYAYFSGWIPYFLDWIQYFQ
jgi:hypothetical protein